MRTRRHSQPWFRQRSLSGYIVCLQRQLLAAMTRKSQTQSPSTWHSETDIGVLLPMIQARTHGS